VIHILFGSWWCLIHSWICSWQVISTIVDDFSTLVLKSLCILSVFVMFPMGRSSVPSTITRVQWQGKLVDIVLPVVIVVMIEFDNISVVGFSKNTRCHSEFLLIIIMLVIIKLCCG
jgi:hypothetical protein